MFGYKDFNEWKKANQHRTPAMQPFNGTAQKQYSNMEKLARRNLNRAKSLMIYYQSVGDISNQAKQAEQMYRWAGILENAKKQ